MLKQVLCAATLLIPPANSEATRPAPQPESSELSSLLPTQDELPACVFPPEVERTYDRSFARFVEVFQGRGGKRS